MFEKYLWVVVFSVSEVFIIVEDYSHIAFFGMRLNERKELDLQ
jgi:hypothetical protein